MAELEFIMGRNEQLQIMDYITHIGGLYLPCIGYKISEGVLINNSSEALQVWEAGNMARGSGPIYVLWKDISIYPMKYTQIEKIDGVFYYPGEGGPYLDFLPSKIIKKDGKPYLSNGIVGYLHNYGIFKEGSWLSIPAPEELKDKYKQIVKFIKSMSTKVKWLNDSRRSYWIGREALKMLKEGANAGIELQLPKLQ